MNLRKENSRHEESSMDCLQRIFCVMLSGKTDSAKQEYMYTISYNVVQIYDILLCFYDFLCLFNNTSCVFREKMFVVKIRQLAAGSGAVLCARCAIASLCWNG